MRCNISFKHLSKKLADGIRFPFVNKFHLLTVVCCAGFFLVFSGCSNDALDPTQIGRFRPVPVVNVILDTLGVADEPDPVYASSEEPGPADVYAHERDYVFSPGDTIRISIYELQREREFFVNDYVVTETGRISIPDVGLVQAAGLTEVELEEEIKDILSPNLIPNPAVTATLFNSQKRTYSITGNGIGNDGRYPIPRYDYRLSEAIATAGGLAEFNMSYIYIRRKVEGSRSLYRDTPGQNGQLSPQQNQQRPGDAFGAEQLQMRPVEPGTTGGQDNEDQMLELIEPYAREKGIYNSDQIIISTAEMITDSELEQLAAPEGFDPPVNTDTSEDAQSDRLQTRQDVYEHLQSDQGRIEWVFRDGKWQPLRVGGESEKPQQPQSRQYTQKEPSRQYIPETETGPAQWDDIGSGGVQMRLIRIDVDKFRAGDPRYNVIIKPGDVIEAPLDVIGEFYVMGNVNNVGAVNLTGRPITLKQAITAAGGLGPLAYPKKVEVIRRLGKDREEIVMVDLEKIAAGRQPDFFIKPHDTINVGTHGTSRWMAVLRNAFRAEYGFGFTYSRNFADSHFGDRIFPNWAWDDVSRIF